MAGLAFLIVAALGAAPAPQRPPLVIHEWGTFTALQDETGRALPGVNVNEEPLPAFVHRLNGHLATDSHGYSAVLGTKFQLSKGMPRAFPLAFLRMETPIIYLHTSVPRTIDLSVDFRRGWISEWYPKHTAIAPSTVPRDAAQIRLEDGGRIAWHGLRLTPPGGADSQRRDLRPPATDSPVWLAPRQVRAAMVTSKDGQTEHYLFYRGIANMNAPLMVARKGENLAIRSRFAKPTTLRALYLVDTRRKGRVGFRRVGPVPSQADAKPIWSTPAKLADSEFGELDWLWDAMRNDLMADGLFHDEAEAMLNTWRASYFEAPGLRLFFLLPQSWTDRELPLKVSERSGIERVMVGRIELVTTEHRRNLSVIAAGPISDRTWFWQAVAKLPKKQQATIRSDIVAGKKTLASLGIAIPPDYRAYMRLGRFRDALILDAARDKSKKNLQRFVEAYHLSYFKPLKKSR